MVHAVIAQVFFGSANLWMPLATPLLVELPLALLIGLLSQYGLARRQQNRMQRALSHYVPARVAQGLADHPADLVSVKEPVYAACLAADAENFTSLAEGMTPEAAASYLNSYFDALAEAMSRHRADVIKFHVNGAMCAWTATGPDPSVRARACLAALAAVEAINAFNARCPPLCLEVGVGLHAGSALLGHIGGGGHFDFEIVGDIASTAVRIEEFNKQLGTRVLASEAAVADLDDFLFRPLGAFLLKGKKNATAIVEIVAAQERASMAQIALCGRFANALAAFQEHDWRQAAEQFEAILASHPDDGPSRFYLDNCQSRRKSGHPES
jgi:adenylate cyclase